jgi:hypothetical protein
MLNNMNQNKVQPKDTPNYENGINQIIQKQLDQSSKHYKKNQVVDIRLTTAKRIKEERQSSSLKLNTVRLPHDRCGYI